MAKWEPRLLKLLLGLQRQHLRFYSGSNNKYKINT